ncbi:MAG: short-chain dehydrogenase [Actinobacteria bacterium 13_1_20CM_3_71_11]|nr:MAG: short-chain dehydrogenase [Actinobacteria bacterium 13_1_20CM_3_71_11]
MPDSGCVVVVGGTSGLGHEVARHYADLGWDTVLTGRDPEHAAKVAAELGGSARGIGLDLTRPAGIAAALADVGPVEYLVLSAIARDENTATGYDHAASLELVTLKLVGYLEVVHALRCRIAEDGAIVVFGGLAKDRPYPGSVTVSTVNGGVTGMVNVLATELAPIRVNAIHPGIVGDSPYWTAKPPGVLDAVRARTPTGRLVTMADIVDAVAFLLENRSVNAANLAVDGGTLLR